jgi:hypothetical protein
MTFIAFCRRSPGLDCFPDLFIGSALRPFFFTLSSKKTNHLSFFQSQVDVIIIVRGYFAANPDP